MARSVNPGGRRDDRTVQECGLSTTANDLAAATTAEVYVLLVGSLIVSFGGIRQGARALGIRSIRPKTAAAGVALVALVWAVVIVAYALAGVLGALVEALVWIGRDGRARSSGT